MNSWHNHWETNVFRDEALRKKSLRLWLAAERYKEILLEVTDGLLPPESSDDIVNLLLNQRLVQNSELRYLECGHRAIAVKAICDTLDIKARNVTLYSDWHQKVFLTHHVLEIEGENGWEFHDPDFGFCIINKESPLSIQEILIQNADKPFKLPVGASVYDYTRNKIEAYYVNRLFALGFFRTSSITDSALLFYIKIRIQMA